MRSSPPPSSSPQGLERATWRKYLPIPGTLVEVHRKSEAAHLDVIKCKTLHLWFDLICPLLESSQIYVTICFSFMIQQHQLAMLLRSFVSYGIHNPTCYSYFYKGHYNQLAIQTNTKQPGVATLDLSGLLTAPGDGSWKPHKSSKQKGGGGKSDNEEEHLCS